MEFDDGLLVMAVFAVGMLLMPAVKPAMAVQVDLPAAGVGVGIGPFVPSHIKPFVNMLVAQFPGHEVRYTA